MIGYFRAYSNRAREASRELEERELRIYMALLTWANCEGMCWPGIKTLVETTGLCTDAVLTALEGLTVKNYVIVVRKGTRDVLTHSMLPNVYRVSGAVVDDDCSGDEYRTDDPILDLNLTQESQHHHRTDSENTTKETRPETPPPAQPAFFEVEERKQEKPKSEKRGKTKTETPTRSVIPQTPTPVSPPPPPRIHRGILSQFADPLPDIQEAAALRIYELLKRKTTLRMARAMIHVYGESNTNWAIGHLAKQSDVFNPPGYVITLLERRAVEQSDAAPINPGDEYITGPWADLIEH